MNLKELQSMIKEELENYMGEADDIDVSVSDADVDAEMGDEEDDASDEDVLRTIYDMLKAKFEGGEEDMGDEEMPMDDVEEMGMDEESMDEAYGEKKGGNATNSSGKYGGSYGATGTDTGDSKLHEGFTSRMKKLANIKG